MQTECSKIPTRRRVRELGSIGKERTMKANESGADRATRVVVGIIALIVAFVVLDVMSGAVLGIIVAAAGGIMILTGFCGFCPAYKLVGLSTCKKQSCCGCGTGSCKSKEAEAE